MANIPFQYINIFKCDTSQCSSLVNMSRVSMRLSIGKKSMISVLVRIDEVNDVARWYESDFSRSFQQFPRNKFSKGSLSMRCNNQLVVRVRLQQELTESSQEISHVKVLGHGVIMKLSRTKLSQQSNSGSILVSQIWYIKRQKQKLDARNKQWTESDFSRSSKKVPKR